MKMTKEEYKKDVDFLTEKIGSLIFRNMTELGSDFETAKKQAFNRMEKNFPGIIQLYKDLALASTI